MKYLVNNSVGIVMLPKYAGIDKYITVDVNKGDTFFIIEHNNEYVGVFDIEGVEDFVEKHMDNISVTMYRTNEFFKMATLMIDKIVSIKIHSYSYSCHELIMLFNKLIDNSFKNQIITNGKVFYDVTYKASGSTFCSRFDSIIDAGVLLDNLEDENIVKIDMVYDNNRVATISNFDDVDDIFTLYSTTHFGEISDIVDLFEQFLR